MEEEFMRVKQRVRRAYVGNCKVIARTLLYFGSVKHITQDVLSPFDRNINIARIADYARWTFLFWLAIAIIGKVKRDAAFSWSSVRVDEREEYTRKCYYVVWEISLVEWSRVGWIGGYFLLDQRSTGFSKENSLKPGRIDFKAVISWPLRIWFCYKFRFIHDRAEFENGRDKLYIRFEKFTFSDN